MGHLSRRGGRQQQQQQQQQEVAAEAVEEVEERGRATKIMGMGSNADDRV
jgi:hypothetical protein